MANLRALVKRRKAVRNIRKITRTMELIATARFKKALDRATEAEAFTRKIAETRRRPDQERRRRDAPAAGHAAGEEVAAAGHHRQPRAVRRVQRQHHPRGDGRGPPATARRTSRSTWKSSGKRGIAFFKFQGIPRAARVHALRGQADVRGGGGDRRPLHRPYIAGQIDEVKVAYMKFINAARQEPVVETLLPLSSVAVETRKPQRRRSRPRPARSTTSSCPDAAEILEELVPAAFKVRLFKCFLDAAVSEQIARRVAMKAATENAGDLIKEITRRLQPDAAGEHHQGDSAN